ncbi:MAG: lipopolysaccharide transport periplasmic protein LptA [Deltaproteobacteria bacterium]|nr:MAG: lipopolysaccharide transport periplasmic protein LptA [Deltaproteobacteria bacterium]
MRGIFLVIFYSLLFAAPGQTEESPQEGGQKAGAGPIVIKSQSLEVDNQKRIVIFTGQVDARRDDMTINCEKMIVYYIDQSANKESEKTGVRIDKIVASGKVKISRPDGALAMAEKGVYYESDEKVVLTGRPVVKQGDDFVEGSRITLYLKEKRSIVEGSEKEKVRAVLHPRSEKR